MYSFLRAEFKSMFFTRIINASNFLINLFCSIQGYEVAESLRSKECETLSV